MQLQQPLRLCLLDDTPLIVSEKVTCNISVAGEESSVQLLIAEILCPVPLGRDVLKKLNLVFDLNENAYCSTSQQPIVKFPLISVQIRDGDVICNSINAPNNSPVPSTELITLLTMS